MQRITIKNRTGQGRGTQVWIEGQEVHGVTSLSLAPITSDNMEELLELTLVLTAFTLDVEINDNDR